MSVAQCAEGFLPWYLIKFGVLREEALYASHMSNVVFDVCKGTTRLT